MAFHTVVVFDGAAVIRTVGPFSSIEEAEAWLEQKGLTGAPSSGEWAAVIPHYPPDALEADAITPESVSKSGTVVVEDLAEQPADEAEAKRVDPATTDSEREGD